MKRSFCKCMLLTGMLNDENLLQIKELVKE